MAGVGVSGTFGYIVPYFSIGLALVIAAYVIGGVTKGRLLPMNEALADIKNTAAFVSFEGTTSIRRYWATFFRLPLPLFVLYLLLLGYTGELESLYWIAAVAMYGALLFSVALLVMVPLMVRRAREIGLPPVVGVLVPGLGALPIPYIPWAAFALIVALGCVPAGLLQGKVSIPEKVARALQSIPVAFLWLIAILGIQMLVLRGSVGIYTGATEREMKQASKELERDAKEAKRIFKDMSGALGSDYSDSYGY